MSTILERPRTPDRAVIARPDSAQLRRRAAVRLSVVTCGAMSLAGALGLGIPDVYGSDDATAAMLRGYDAVTLVVAVPLLAWALLRLRTGSLVAQLVWVSMLGYAIYTSAMYLFGAGFNDLFPLHVVVLSSAVFAFPLALSTLPTDRVPVLAHGKRRVVSAVLALLAMGLGGMWLVAVFGYVVDGTIPSGSALVESDAVVHAAIALDLALLVPGYAVAAVLLWRGAGWGFVSAAVLLVSGAVHQVAYLVALPFQVAADVPGATSFDPAEPVIAGLFVAAAVALLASARSVRATRTPG